MARLAGKGRYYRVAMLDADGKPTQHTYQFISVTSVLDAVVAKPKLMHWYYRQGVEGMAELVRKYGGKVPNDADSIASLLSSEGLSPYSKRNKAANQGTEVHSNLEALAEGKAVRRTKKTAALLDWWDERLLSPKHVVKCEVPLISFRYGYAGTVDLVYNDPQSGELRLCDLKTGKYVHWTHFVQGQAYAQAWVENFGPEVDRVTVLHAPEAVSMDAVKWAELSSDEVTFDTFKTILDIYRWLPDDWMPEDLDE